MLEKVEIKEIMTINAAVRKYSTKHFLMYITEFIDHGYNDLGYVIYTADKERDLLKVPKDEYEGKPVCPLYGGAAEPFPSFGNVVYHDND